MLKSQVELSQVCFGYVPGEPFINNLSIAFRASSVVGVMGQSGSGKSTILRLIAGIEAPLAGKIRIDDLTPEAAACAGRISMAFQQHLLLPWLSCEKNAALGLRLLDRGVDKAQVRATLDRFGLGDSYEKFPHELSGGMAQRAALVRALVPKPDLLLLDEPLTSIDWPLRRLLLSELRDILREESTTAIIVSHDSRELAYLCDEVHVVVRRLGEELSLVKATALPSDAQRDFNSPEFHAACVQLDSAVMS